MPGRSTLGRCTTRGAGAVGNGGVGVVGRCSSMRSRKVGGTMRPAAGFGGGAGIRWDRSSRATPRAELRPAVSPVRAPPRPALPPAARARPARRQAPARALRSEVPRVRHRRSASASAGTATGGLTALTRRGGGNAGAAGLTGSAGLLRRRALLAFDDGSLREDVAARQRNVALTRETLDELARDDFLDGARGALHLDAVVALEQRRDLLARGGEQFRDFVNPDSGQAVSFFLLQGGLTRFALPD